MKTRSFRVLLANLLFLLAVTGCSTEEGGTLPPEVSEILPGEEGTLELPAGNYLLIPYSLAPESRLFGYTLTPSAGGGGRMEEGVAGGAGFSSPAALSARRGGSGEARSPYEAHLRAEIALHKRSRRLAPPPAAARPLPAEAVLRRHDETIQVDMSVFNCGSGVVDALLRTETDIAHYYVDPEDDPDLPDAAIERFAEVFDTIIVPRVRFFFGDEERDYGNPGPIDIVFTSCLSEAEIDGKSAFLIGSFVASVMEESGHKVIFALPPGFEGISDDLLAATLAHELTHLIDFSSKVRVGRQEDAWLDEGLAHLAEDLSGYGIDLPTIVSDPETGFLAHVNETALTGSDTEDTLMRRGAAYLFLRYLFERAGGVTVGTGSPADLTDDGGASVLGCLVASGEVGIGNVDRCAGFPSHFADWTATLVVDASAGTITADPRFNYAAPRPDPFTGHPRGIDLQAGGGPAIFGPLAGNESGTVPHTGMRILSASFSISTTVTVTGEAGGEIGLTAVQIP